MVKSPVSMDGYYPGDRVVGVVRMQWHLTAALVYHVLTSSQALTTYKPIKLKLSLCQLNTNHRMSQIVVSVDKLGEVVENKTVPVPLAADGSLAVLLLAFTSNQWCRQAVYYLCDFTASADPARHMNAALSFDKDMYALLASLGFTLVFSTVSLFAGSVADRFDRKNIVLLSCVGWSLATLLQGRVTTYGELLPLRVLVGFSQAFFNPAAYTLLADVFPRGQAGRAAGVLNGGVYLGGGLASLSILLDNAVGWRDTLIFIGLVGLVAAAVCGVALKESRPAVARESAISAAETVEALQSNWVQWKDSLGVILSSPEARLLLAGAAVRFGAGFTIGVWKAPFVFAKFPAAAALFAGSNAAIVSGGGLLSSVLGGYLSDGLSASGEGKRPRARAWVAAAGSLLAAPLWAGFLTADSPGASSAWLLGEYLVAECWVGPALAALFETVDKSRRGAAQGLFSLLTAAGNFAPLLVGYLSSGLAGPTSVTGVPGLGDAMLYCGCGFYVASGLLFTQAATLRETAALGEQVLKKSTD